MSCYFLGDVAQENQRMMSKPLKYATISTSTTIAALNQLQSHVRFNSLLPLSYHCPFSSPPPLFLSSYLFKPYSARPFFQSRFFLFFWKIFSLWIYFLLLIFMLLLELLLMICSHCLVNMLKWIEYYVFLSCVDKLTQLMFS